MARRSFRRGELLLVVLKLLERLPMDEGTLLRELDALVADEYRWRPGELPPALDALEVEGLVERSGYEYALTPEGQAALAERRDARVLQRLGRSNEDVTIVFTDLVGSTQLLERLGEDAAHELRRRHFALLRRAVRQHGGREVKSLGDGLMVVFAGPAAALACADAMQAAVSECGDRVELRVGIASGEVVREDGDYFGRAVVVARRLCDTARGGEVLVAGLEDEGLRPVGPLTLKGLSAPVLAAALVA